MVNLNSERHNKIKHIANSCMDQSQQYLLLFVFYFLIFLFKMYCNLFWLVITNTLLMY